MSQNSGEEYVYEPGPDGYRFTNLGLSAKEFQISSLASFCKSIAWRPDKLDNPSLRCIAVVPAGPASWLCVIEEADRDQYGRNLTVRTTARLHENQNLPSALAAIAADCDIDLEENGITEPDCKFGKNVSIIGDCGLLNFYGTAKRPGQENNIDNRIEVCPRREVPMSYTQSNSSSVQRPSPVVSMTLCLLVGLAVGAVSVGAWFQISRVAQLQNQLQQEMTNHAELQEAAAAFLPPGGKVTPTTIERAYSQLASEMTQIKNESENWRSQANDLFPGTITPTDLERSVLQLRQDLGRASGPLSDEDRRQLEFLQTNDEFHQQLQTLVQTAEKLKSLSNK